MSQFQEATSTTPAPFQLCLRAHQLIDSSDNVRIRWIRWLRPKQCPAATEHGLRWLWPIYKYKYRYATLFLYIPDATQLDCLPRGTLAKLGLTRTFSYLQDSVLPRPELALEARRTIPARAPLVATQVDLAVLEVRRECTICSGCRGSCLLCGHGVAPSLRQISAAL